MTNALTIYERMNELQTAANAMHASGMFADVKTQAQALVKIMAGAEMGLPPFASMSGIHLVQGKPVIGATLIATMVKNDPRYDYRVKRADAVACEIVWYENGQPVGESSFTMAEAAAAGLTGKDNWKKYTSDMLFARALTRGARRYAPGIFGGAAVYTPDEFNLDTDAEGQIINVTPAPVVTVTTPAATFADNGPLPDDEQVIYETSTREFIPAVAALLETDTGTIKARLHALGYERIPGARAKRIDVYRRLKTNLGDNVQADMFGEPEPATDGAYQE